MPAPTLSSHMSLTSPLSLIDEWDIEDPSDPGEPLRFDPFPSAGLDLIHLLVLVLPRESFGLSAVNATVTSGAERVFDTSMLGRRGAEYVSPPDGSFVAILVEGDNEPVQLSFTGLVANAYLDLFVLNKIGSPPGLARLWAQGADYQTDEWMSHPALPMPTWALDGISWRWGVMGEDKDSGSTISGGTIGANPLSAYAAGPTWTGPNISIPFADDVMEWDPTQTGAHRQYGVTLAVTVDGEPPLTPSPPAQSCDSFEYTYRWAQIVDADPVEAARLLDERDRELEEHLTRCECDCGGGGCV